MENSSQKYKPKLIVISSRFPYPLQKGDKLRLYYQIRELSEFFDIYLISLSESEVVEVHKEKLQTFCKEVHVFQINTISKYFFTCLQVLSSLPFQVGYFTNPFIKKKIKTLINRIAPDHIYCQLIRVAEYVKDYHLCPKTIDYMDALSLGMERRAKNANNPIHRNIFKTESKRLKRYEKQLFDYFEHHSIISKQDKQAIVHPSKEKIKVIPNGVDDFFFEKPNVPIIYDLVFTGNLSYAPNVEACVFIVKELLPLLPKETKVLLAGASPSNIVKSLVSERVHASGWVDDIRESYAQGKIFIAPMFIGTGLQNKLLEAMALGIPAITTPLANNALGASEGKEILIAETANDFKNCIEKLNNDARFYETIKANARNFVKNKYSWKETTKELISLVLD